MTSGVYPRTEKTRKKMSLARKGKPLSELSKHKIKDGYTLEVRKKMSQSHKKRGTVPPSRKGIKYPEEVKRTMGAKRGKEHPLWKGGFSRGYKTGYYSKKYCLWRTSIFERDSYRCQTCGQVGIYLTAHHIKSFAHYPKLRFDINNGITLCESCHSLTDNYKGRNKRKVG